MDEDLNALRGTVSRRGINWPQICDSQGRKSEIAKIFNAAGPGFWGFPRSIVLDRDGKIVANYVGSKSMPRVAGVVTELLKK
jgi:hypothetical protein